MKSAFLLLAIFLGIVCAQIPNDLNLKYDPYTNSHINQIIFSADRQNDLMDMSDRVERMIRRVATTPPPPPRANPVLSPLFDDLVKSLGGVKKVLDKEHTEHPADDPAQMKMYGKLMSNLRKSHRRLDFSAPKPAATSKEIGAIKNLIYQQSQVESRAETPEQLAMHQKAHAQSRIIHRLSHAVERMSDTFDDDQRERYEHMLALLMHGHLSDPYYHDDPLHDHLLAHHIARKHRDDEFADHLAHHVLFSNLDNHIEHDHDIDRQVGSILAQPLTLQEAEVSQMAQKDLQKLQAENEQAKKNNLAKVTAELKQRTQTATPAPAPAPTPAPATK
jgi:hypothetical protein